MIYVEARENLNLAKTEELTKDYFAVKDAFIGSKHLGKVIFSTQERISFLKRKLHL
jgi:hypothetical protein